MHRLDEDCALACKATLVAPLRQEDASIGLLKTQDSTDSTRFSARLNRDTEEKRRSLCAPTKEDGEPYRGLEVAALQGKLQLRPRV